MLREAGADYVLAVKGNQPNLQQAVIQFFDAMEQHESDGVEFQHHETLDEKRGRRERRQYWAAPVPAALAEPGDRRQPANRRRGDYFSYPGGNRSVKQCG